MEKVIIKAEKRSVTGKKVGALRRSGKLPGIIYGHNVTPTPIMMDRHSATRVLSAHTGSALITLDIEGQEQPTLVREKQRDVVRGDLLHVDFQVVSMTEKIRTGVSIVLQGLAPAIKDFNGVVVSGLNELQVESLPQDLPESIPVDLTRLANIGDGIYVRDIQPPANITILDDPEEMVALVTFAKEEEVPVEEVAPVEEPEVIERGKKEEEAEEEE